MTNSELLGMGSGHWVSKLPVLVHCGAKTEKHPTQPIQRKWGQQGRSGQEQKWWLEHYREHQMYLCLHFCWSSQVATIIKQVFTGNQFSEQQWRQPSAQVAQATGIGLRVGFYFLMKPSRELNYVSGAGGMFIRHLTWSFSSWNGKFSISVL